MSIKHNTNLIQQKIDEACLMATMDVDKNFARRYAAAYKIWAESGVDTTFDFEHYDAVRQAREILQKRLDKQRQKRFEKLNALDRELAGFSPKPPKLRLEINASLIDNHIAQAKLSLALGDYPETQWIIDYIDHYGNYLSAAVISDGTQKITVRDIHDYFKSNNIGASIAHFAQIT